MDKVTRLLLEALKQALAETHEQRLFRSGKLPGLFAGRGRAHSTAAERALREGLLEVVRRETKGKTLMEWVRATPRAVDFVHSHESPLAALKELQVLLQTTQEGLPAWLTHIQQRIHETAAQLANDVSAMGRRLEVLRRRVEEAIVRVESAQPQVSEKLADLVPWANEVVQYLDRRLETGEAPCPLSEMFSALRTNHPVLTVAEYHAGLRRLFDRGIIRLLPSEGTNGLPEPEYALLDGLKTYYFVTRGGNV